MARAGRRNGRGHRVDEPTQTFVEDPPRTDEDDDGDAGEAVAGADHNGRLKSLNDLVEEWCDLQDKEDALLKKHIDPVREDKAEVKATAKNDFDIPTQAFNARAMMRRIERMKDNDEVVLALAELFKATPVGQNLDLFAAAERVAKKKAEKAAEAEAKKTKVTAPTEKAL